MDLETFNPHFESKCCHLISFVYCHSVCDLEQNVILIGWAGNSLIRLFPKGKLHKAVIGGQYEGLVGTFLTNSLQDSTRWYDKNRGRFIDTCRYKHGTFSLNFAVKQV